MMTRVAVFIDYQNMYHGARRAFADLKARSPIFGHVHPVALGRLLTELGHSADPNRKLVATTVYRGQPGRRSPRKLAVTTARQIARWHQHPSLTVKTLPLRYQKPETPGERWRAEEKGIDVMLALDLVLGAHRDQFDTAVVASCDTDLRPALTEVLHANKRIETASWVAPPRTFTALRLPGHDIWNHYMTREHFLRVQDDTDYLFT